MVEQTKSDFYQQNICHRCYNSGRVVSAAAPYLIGHVSEHAGLGYALCITSAAFLAAALIATRLRLSPALAIPEPEPDQEPLPLQT